MKHKQLINRAIFLWGFALTMLVLPEVATANFEICSADYILRSFLVINVFGGIFAIPILVILSVFIQELFFRMQKFFLRAIIQAISFFQLLILLCIIFNPDLGFAGIIFLYILFVSVWTFISRKTAASSIT